MSSMYSTIAVFVWALKISLCLGMTYMIDLSHDINEKTPIWPTTQPYMREAKATGWTPKGFWLEWYRISLSEHTGTHMDAPSHLKHGKWTVDQIPLTHLIGRGIVIDIQNKVAKNSTAELSVEDITNWMNKNGPLPDGAIVFVRTGWGSKYNNKKEYYGSENDTSKLVFPGISKEAAQFFVSDAKLNGNRVFGVGIDGPSIDNGPSTLYESHRILFNENIYGLENVANLDKLPAKGFDVTVMPVKLRGGTGAPVRIVAFLHSPIAIEPLHSDDAMSAS